MNRSIILHRMGRSKLFMTGFFGVMVVIILTLIAPLIIVHDPYTSSLTMRLSPPEWFSNGWSGYILGTDAVGRDILTRLLIGARYSLFVALVVSCSACLIGVTVGMISGYCGGIVDMLLAIVVVTIFGTGLKNLVIILICKSFFSKVLKLLAFQGVWMFLCSQFPLFFPLSGKNKGKSYCTLSSSFAASRLASLLACA